MDDDEEEEEEEDIEEDEKERGRKEKKQVAVPLVLNANWKQRVTSNKQQAKKIVDRLAQLDVHSTQLHSNSAR